MGNSALVVAGVVVAVAVLVMRRRLTTEAHVDEEGNGGSADIESGAGGEQGGDASAEEGSSDETTALLACVDDIRVKVADRMGSVLQNDGVGLASDSVGAVHRVYRGQLVDLVEKANAAFLPLSALPEADGQTKVTTDAAGRQYFSITQDDPDANASVLLDSSTPWTDLVSEWGEGVRDLRTALNCATLAAAGVAPSQCEEGVVRGLTQDITQGCQEGTAGAAVTEFEGWFEV